MRASATKVIQKVINEAFQCWDEDMREARLRHGTQYITICQRLTDEYLHILVKTYEETKNSCKLPPNKGEQRYICNAGFDKLINHGTLLTRSLAQRCTTKCTHNAWALSGPCVDCTALPGSGRDAVKPPAWDICCQPVSVIELRFCWTWC